jgi:hypothetical protein
MMKSELLNEYRPYNSMPEFYEGWRDYENGQMHDSYLNARAQAYGRGAEAAMRWQRQGHKTLTCRERRAS